VPVARGDSCQRQPISTSLVAWMRRWPATTRGPARKAGLVLPGRNGQRIDPAGAGRGIAMSLQGDGFPP
jgi:hypothetical protein